MSGFLEKNIYLGGQEGGGVQSAPPCWQFCLLQYQLVLLAPPCGLVYDWM